MVVVGVMLAVNPTHRTVSETYHAAAANWWTQGDLYTGPRGMNYLPHFAVLYSPFHFLPLALCEVLWRYCAAAAIVGGLGLLTRRLFPSGNARTFLWATLLVMPLSMSALRNGNANCTFAGVTLLCIVAVLDRRWWLAAGLMALATAIKPLGIVFMLLVPLYYVSLRGRMLVAFAGLALFPFLFGSPAYVWSQHQDLWINLRSCTEVAQHRFADINGLLRTFGLGLNAEPSRWIRVIAGGLTAVLWWAGARRLKEPLVALWLYGLATSYLMLFNPMTEANSYGILAPALGAWALVFLFRAEGSSARALGWVIVFMALTMGLMPNVVRPLLGNSFALFWHPLMTLLFVTILAAFVGRSTSPARQPQAQPA